MTAEAIELSGRVPAAVHLSRHLFKRLGSWVRVAQAWERIVESAPPGLADAYRAGHAPPHVVDQAIAWQERAL